MKIISQKQIKDLGISPATCVEWVRESFCMKHQVDLPTKISMHPQGIDFFNTMPCQIPAYNLFSLKEVHRVKDAVPALGSDIWLYDSSKGELLAMMDCDWITGMRTGAVATLAAQTFRKGGDITYSIMGLGNTGRATILCLLDSEPDVMHNIILLKYKDQADLFQERFANYHNVNFIVVDDAKEMVSNSDVIFSCVTEARKLVCDDNSLFKPGCLVVPVHTRGFQNCDLFFDKVYADDRGHVHGFKYFDQFRQFAELTDVLLGDYLGRENDTERILSYNIGLGLHDAVYAWKIYNMLAPQAKEVKIEKETAKFWI